MSRPISPEQYEPSWNAAAQADAEARRESGPPDDDRTADGLLSILNRTFDTRHPVNRTPEHLRTDDLPTYSAAKGDGTGMRGWR